MIRSKTIEEMGIEGLRVLPTKTLSNRIITNETQILLHFFQGRISAIPRTDLFLASSNTGMCLLALSFLNVLLFGFPAGQGLKNDFSTFF